MHFAPNTPNSFLSFHTSQKMANPWMSEEFAKKTNPRLYEQMMEFARSVNMTWDEYQAKKHSQSEIPKEETRLEKTIKMLKEHLKENALGMDFTKRNIIEAILVLTDFISELQNENQELIKKINEQTEFIDVLMEERQVQIKQKVEKYALEHPEMIVPVVPDKDRKMNE